MDAKTLGAYQKMPR